VLSEGCIEVIKVRVNWANGQKKRGEVIQSGSNMMLNGRGNGMAKEEEKEGGRDQKKQKCSENARQPLNKRLCVTTSCCSHHNQSI
jgi:hypothetical protein